MRLRALHADFGVEISGIDLGAALPDSAFDLIRTHYDRHSLLLFRDQDLPPAAQADLCHRLGQPKIETRKQFNFREHPEVSTIGNVTAGDGRPLAFFVRGGFGWHVDGTAACHVDAATLLYAVEVPERGGDTLFLSTAAAYERLPADLRDRLETLSFKTSFHAHNDPLYQSNPDAFIPLSSHERAALPDVWHRIVQTHPVSGRKLLYLSLDPIEFDQAGLDQGRDLIERVMSLASRPAAVYRHHWQPGDLLIWDNHAMMHSATPTQSYESDRRLMHRSFVYTQPTARPLPNYAELCKIFMPTADSIGLSDFD